MKRACIKKEKFYNLYAASEFTIDNVNNLFRGNSPDKVECCEVAYTHQMLGLSRKYEKEFSLQLNSKHELLEPEVTYDCFWLCLSYQDSESVLQSKISSLFEKENKLFKKLQSDYEGSTNEKLKEYLSSLLVHVIWQSSKKPNKNCIDKFFLKVQKLITMNEWEKCENSSGYIFTRTGNNFSLSVDVNFISIFHFNFTSTYIKKYINFLDNYEVYTSYIVRYKDIKFKFLQWLQEVLVAIENQSSDIFLRLIHFDYMLEHLLMDKKVDDLFDFYPTFRSVINYYRNILLEKTLSSFGSPNSNYSDFNLQLPYKQTNEPWDVLSEVLASINEHDLYHDKQSETLKCENDLNSLVLHSLKQRGLRTQKEVPVGKNRVDVFFEISEYSIRCECKIAYKNGKLDKKGIEKAIAFQAPSYVANNPGNIETGIVFYLHGENKKKIMDDLLKFIGELGYLFTPKVGCNRMHYELSSGKKVIEPNPVNVICVFFESKSNTALSLKPKE